MKQKGLALLALILGLVATGWASDETVLWNFSDSNGDGAFPWSNVLISDSKGNLYGVTGGGGSNTTGTVFELSPNGTGGYNETVLYDFKAEGSGDGSTPYGTLARDAAGNLYGATQGGGANNTGTVFMLSPKAGGGWLERILYSFSASGITDGQTPSGGVIIGKDRTLYGTTTYGGTYSAGTVFQISRTSGGITEKVLHSFGASGDGEFPYDPVVADPQGNLYGAISIGGASGAGCIYRLTLQNGSWTENLLYSFTGQNGDGSGLYYIGLIGDKSYDIYGTTSFGGTNGTGTVWELVYSKGSNSYSEKILYSFGPSNSGDGNYPYAGLTMDGAGTLFGTTEQGGSTQNSGTVYKLTKSGSTWTESVVHNFTGGVNDGQDPSGNLLLGGDGNLYGMAQFGGRSNDGIVYSIAP
ncbi:MAG TPA: choice-of-anchor tandem repeat GloVer-containing protein [Terriglobales bacterium]|nr:choice-of-anchor tandem repeat GloVer-containing protein [Terriglobales bacterium]